MTRHCVRGKSPFAASSRRIALLRKDAQGGARSRPAIRTLGAVVNTLGEDLP